MRGVGLIMISSIWTAAGNLCLKKNLDYQGSPSGFLVSYYLFSFIAAALSIPIFFNPSVPFSLTMFATGGIVGALSAGLMLLTSVALRLGPAGLTFAFVAAAAIVPSLVLPVVFGKEYGFIFTMNLILGLILIVVGLFWGSYSQRSEEKGSYRIRWLLCACSLLLIQGFILCLFQWRCLIMKPEVPNHLLLFVKCFEEEEVWFMPGMFSVAVAIQSLFFFFTEKRFLRREELGFGALGGLANGASTFFLLAGTRVATGIEKSILFPCFAIGTIVLCNLWGQYLYKENVNWKANACCLLGILVAFL